MISKSGWRGKEVCTQKWEIYTSCIHWSQTSFKERVKGQKYTWSLTGLKVEKGEIPFIIIVNILMKFNIKNNLKYIFVNLLFLVFHYNQLRFKNILCTYKTKKSQ